jgi:RimJ/RimL family protein N-acetyltransferase
VDPGNTPSLRVAARLGLTYESDTELFGKTVQRHVLASAGG